MFAATAQTDFEPHDAHEILKNDRRRLTLQCLRKYLEPVSLRTLSERVAALEDGESPPPRDLRKSVYVSLHQTHLPKLAEIGVVDYDKSSKEIALCKRARHISPYMNESPGLGITWESYYRTLGVVGLVLVVLAEIGVPPLAGVDSLLITTVMLFVLMLSMAYQLWKRRWIYLCALFAPDE